jgi:hypothetical protein
LVFLPVFFLNVSNVLDRNGGWVNAFSLRTKIYRQVLLRSSSGSAIWCCMCIAPHLGFSGICRLVFAVDSTWVYWIVTALASVLGIFPLFLFLVFRSKLDFFRHSADRYLARSALSLDGLELHGGQLKDVAQ